MFTEIHCTLFHKYNATKGKHFGTAQGNIGSGAMFKEEAKALFLGIFLGACLQSVFFDAVAVDFPVVNDFPKPLYCFPRQFRLLNT